MSVAEVGHAIGLKDPALLELVEKPDHHRARPTHRMNPHRSAKLAPLSRAELVRRVVELHPPVAAVAAGSGLSVRSVHKWLARFRTEGAAGLANRSSRPKRSPGSLPRQRILRLLARRRRKLPGFQTARLARRSKASGARILRRQAGRLEELSPPPARRRSARAHPGALLPFGLKAADPLRPPGPARHRGPAGGLFAGRGLGVPPSPRRLRPAPPG